MYKVGIMFALYLLSIVPVPFHCSYFCCTSLYSLFKPAHFMCSTSLAYIYWCIYCRYKANANSNRYKSSTLWIVSVLSECTLFRISADNKWQCVCVLVFSFCWTVDFPAAHEVFSWTNACALDEVSTWGKCMYTHTTAKEMPQFPHLVVCCHV